MAHKLTARERRLKEQLDELMERYHRPEYLAGDPLVVAHRYRQPEDQEVVALLAAAFASGNIKSILHVLDQILDRLGPSPAAWLQETSPSSIRGAFDGIYHRWVRSSDLERMLALIGHTLREYGTLGNLWESVDNPHDPDTVMGLTRFIETITEAPVPIPLRQRQRVTASGLVQELAPVETILLTSPRRGSACKRMNLFLRWVVRPNDGIDLGLWTEFLSPARLIMPVDTHVLRLAKGMKVTKGKTPSAKVAQEITAFLRRLAPEDPIRYDFSFVRAGIDELSMGARKKSDPGHKRPGP